MFQRLAFVVYVLILCALGEERVLQQAEIKRRPLNGPGGARPVKKKVVEEFVPPPPPDFADLALKPPSNLHTNQAFIDACKVFAG